MSNWRPKRHPEGNWFEMLHGELDVTYFVEGRKVDVSIGEEEIIELGYDEVLELHEWLSEVVNDMKERRGENEW